MGYTKVVHGYHFTSTRMVMLGGGREIMSVGGDVEILELLYTADGNVKWNGLCGRGFGCPQELKHRMVMLPGNSTLRYIPPKTGKGDKSWRNLERMGKEDRGEIIKGEKKKKHFKSEEMDQLIRLAVSKHNKKTAMQRLIKLL